MAIRKKKENQESLAERFQKFSTALKSQFENLDPKDPSLWPLAPKALMCLGIVIAVPIAAWYSYLSGFEEDLIAEHNREKQLRQEFSKKWGQAVALDSLKAQREQVHQYVSQLEKQLPSKAEMAALLSDINQAGMGRSLQFDLFKPGNENMREYYAELPITVRVSGKFHDMGAFVSDIAHLSRIVTLNNITVTRAQKDAGLVLDAQVRTYRYLDQEEISSQRKAGK
ncbi:MAG: type 4a pilus biogenesis protein PilO [Comamonas sp.]|nr:type 4a pilus biogenesis protein PilO [Comamonas sp.]